MGINYRTTQSNRHTARISTAMWINRRWRTLYSEIWRRRMWQNISPGPYHYSLDAQPTFRQIRNVCELLHGVSPQKTVFCISNRVEYVKLHVEFTACIEIWILNSRVFHFSRAAFLRYKPFPTLLKNVVQNTIKLRALFSGKQGTIFISTVSYIPKVSGVNFGRQNESKQTAETLIYKFDTKRFK